MLPRLGFENINSDWAWDGNLIQFVVLFLTMRREHECKVSEEEANSVTDWADDEIGRTPMARQISMLKIESK